LARRAVGRALTRISLFDFAGFASRLAISQSHDFATTRDSRIGNKEALFLHRFVESKEDFCYCAPNDG
jgi:hypothetical protein